VGLLLRSSPTTGRHKLAVNPGWSTGNRGCSAQTRALVCGQSVTSDLKLSSNTPTLRSSFWQRLRLQLRHRGRLLAAAFAPAPAFTTAPGQSEQSDLLADLNAAAEGAGVQVWDWNIELNTLQFNRNVVNFYGYDGDADRAQSDPGEFIARAVHPDDQERYRREFISALKGLQPLSIDYRVKHADGTIHPVRLVGEVRRATSGPNVGRATRVVGITLDMSGHAEREARIEAQAKRQQELLDRITLANETANVGMWDWDLASGKLSSDTNMAAIFKDVDLSGVTSAPDFVTHILHPDDRESFIKTMNSTVARGGGDALSLRFRYIVRSGDVEHVQLKGRILRDAHGKALRFLGVSWNITAQVNADEEVGRQTQAQIALFERLRLAADVAGLDIWEWDLLTDRFTADAHMTALNGETHVEFPSGRELLKLIVHPDDLAGYEAKIDDTIKSGDLMTHGYRMLLADGTQRHIKVHARLFRNPEGVAVRMLGVTLDRSEEIEHHNELRDQAEEERTLRDRLNLATETARIAVWDQDMTNGGFTGDARFWQLFGIDTPSADFRVQDGIHPDVRREALAPLYTAFTDPAQNEVLSVRHRTSNPKRELQYVQSHMRLFRDEHGKVTRLLGVTWDVTEEVEATEKLRKQAENDRAWLERFDIATNAAGVHPWEFDLKLGQFSWHNLPKETYGLGDVPLEHYAAALRKIVLPEDLPAYENSFPDALARGVDHYGFRFRIHGVNGSIHHMECAARIINGRSGKPRRIVGVSWNVTKEVLHAEQLKQAAEQERAVVQRLNITTQAAGISPWEFDLKGNVFTWHGMRQPAYGLDDVPLPQYLDALRGIILEEDLPQLVEPTVHAVKNKIENYSYDFRVRGKDGHIHYMHNSVRLLRDTDGKYRFLMGVTLDVTKEVEVKQEIARQAEKERALIERLNVSTQAAGVAPWEFDLKQGCFSWHGPRPQCFGLDHVPVADYFNALLKIVLPEDLPNMTEPARNAIEAGRDFYEYRFRVIGTDGKLHYMQSYGRILRSDRGNIRYCVGVTWDVTKEVEANALLEQRAEENRQLVERLSIATDSAGIGSWEMDLVAQRFLWVENPVKELGIANEDFGSLEEFATHIVPEDRTLLPDHIRTCVEDRSYRFGLRYRAYAVDRSIIHIQTYGRVFVDESGKPIRSLGVSWDVSKTVEAENKLLAQAQQERALTERLGFALEGSGISLWEFDLKLNQYIWTGRRLPILGLDDVPVEEFYEGISKLILPEDFERIHAVPREAVAKGEAGYSVRYRVRGIDGEIHHLRNSVRFLRSASGKPYRMVGITWDVTEEVLVNERLQNQAQQERVLLERLNIATDSAGISSWEIDLQASRFLWIENPLKSVRRPEDGETLTRDMEYFVERVLPEDRNLMPNAIREALKAKHDRIAYRYRVIGNGGEIVHVQTFARLILDDDGTPSRVLGVSWDVTNEVEAGEQLRHQAERLQDAERRLERASLSSSEGHWEADMASGHLWCSSSFHTLLGYLEGELDSRMSALDRLVHDDDRPSYLEALRNHLTQNAAYDVEARLRTAKGEYRWFRIRGMAERDEHGHAKVMAGSIHDIHQHKAIEDAFKLAQRRFERAINGTQDGLWELDIATGNTWCSPRLAILLGYPAQAMEGTDLLLGRIHPDDADKVQKATAAHYRDNALFDVEVRLKDHYGAFRWYRARATAERDADGQATRLSGSLQDVTEARAAREELLRATEAAEAASRAKSAFLANVSHEIRTPMNGIIGMTGLILETPLDRTQRDYADTIRSSADSLLAVINDILDFSKIEAGKLEIESIEMDLRTHIENVGATMAFQAAAKGLELIVNVHPEVPDRVRGDPQRLRQCLINMLGNAIKFTKQGEIVLDVCAVGQHEDRVLTHFEVRDTGAGIAANVIPTLFQPFVQADSSTTRHFGGTGLGLSIVRRLVEMMGGQVGVVSEVGKGSTFFFTLSLEPIDTPAALPTPDAIRGRRILIVDDNATNRRVLSEQLMHAGYRVASAHDGASALELLHHGHIDGKPFDAAILDYQMPDMDGAMLGERINTDAQLTEVRMVALTSLDRQGDAQRFRSLGFAAYLTKPIRSRELLSCMQRVLGGEARQWQMETQPMITRGILGQLEAQQRFQGKVLLVEDNLVNQKVASRYLERMGCTVHIADNGLEGVQAFESGDFDLILMDVQMPVMDGLTATGKIRELEAAHPHAAREHKGRTPIIALTANAMRGDQERCEAAGMDGFLTKPLEIERLREMLERFGLAERTAESSAVKTSIVKNQSTEHAPPLILARLNEITDGDAEFTRELIETFITSSQEQFAEMHDARRAEDRGALARAAHKMKGACANIHALGMRELAYKLEAEAASLSDEHIGQLLWQLEQEFERLQTFVNDPSVLPMPSRAAS
jgi:two-component system sensor histidine kinase/response regulator